MRGRCPFLRRKLVPYVEGGLTARERRRLEEHLAGCEGCRTLVARVRAGDRAGRRFGRAAREAVPPAPEYAALAVRPGAASGQRAFGARMRDSLLRPLASPAAAPALTVLLIVLSAVVIISRRVPSPRTGGPAALSADAGTRRGFVPLRIADFPSTTASRVVTEGLVRGVYFDEEEKTLHIKLVEPGERTEPFVICEVRSPGRMAIPVEGSRVRVYGTAHFDSQPGRGWNEVNPVTGIDIIKR